MRIVDTILKAIDNLHPIELEELQDRLVERGTLALPCDLEHVWES